MLGVLFGLAGAFAFTRLLSGVLVRVSPADPGIFVLVSLLLIAAAFLRLLHSCTAGRSYRSLARASSRLTLLCQSGAYSDVY
jgi:hypothetical protein